jgi:hypothetical protein
MPLETREADGFEEDPGDWDLNDGAEECMEELEAFECEDPRTDEEKEFDLLTLNIAVVYLDLVRQPERQREASDLLATLKSMVSAGAAGPYTSRHSTET